MEEVTGKEKLAMSFIIRIYLITENAQNNTRSIVLSEGISVISFN